jgi:hypothetical protein
MRPAFQLGRNRFCQLLAISAILMLVVMGFVEAAHVHPDGQLDNVHCSICLVAHHSTPIVSAQTVTPELLLTQDSLPARVSEFTPSAPTTHLFSRPPPTV